MSATAAEQSPMANWNAAIRLGIEIGALVGITAWVWSAARDPVRWLVVVAVPLGAAALWGVFRVPGDPGPATVVVPGGIRLLIEAVVLGCGAIGYAVAFGQRAWMVFTFVTVFHYIVAWDRIRWLLER